MKKKTDSKNAAARLAYNEYHRQWAAAHPEKIQQYQRTYWERKAARSEAAPEREGAPNG